MSGYVNMFRVIIWAVVVGVLCGRTCQAAAKTGHYEENWDSLREHKVPEWFKDAKFGCWACWCPSVVVTDKVDFKEEWFGRWMYDSSNPNRIAAFRYMRETYGDQKQFGYKDLIPMLKGEKFNADEWAELFHRAGAKYAGPLAIFHDNYPLWDSAVTRYDAMEVGPKRDIVAEWEKAVKKRGMKFAATFHHAFAWRFYEPAYKYDAADPQYADLYCQPHEPNAPPTKEYLDLWLAKVNEVFNNYGPDLIYFDFGLERVITPEYQRRMFADYYNWAVKHDRQVGVTHKHRNIHQYTGILDFERGREDRLTPYPWQTDTSVSTWFYHNAAEYRSVNEFVDMLADIVSKNGCLFLNVPMRADGSIPDQARPIMTGIGDWLKVNGEAIYGTRPWETFGEGPTRNPGGGFSERKDKPYTAQDIRFTRSKDGRTLYAIVLGWPNSSLTLTSVKVLTAGPNARVALLGYDKTLKFTVNDREQLAIDVPDLDATQRPCEHAYSFKLIGFKLGLYRGEVAAGPFKPTVESLRQYRCPEWFRDAKFGIYMHWGPTSVPAVDEWYGRNMYVQGHPAYEFHVKTYGHPSKFGYKDVVPLWKAEKFDPDRLVRLFKQAGAKYFTPCAVHHDNFDLWDSKHHKWNAVNMGPKKDIIGMCREATLKHALRFGVTTHLARSYSWFNTNKGTDTEGPFKGVPYDGNDPKYEDFYFEKHSDTDRRHPRNPPESWRRHWAARIKDLIDHYHPDHLYLDGAIPFMGDDNGQTGMEVIAHYYNHNMGQHGGRQEGAMFIKHISDHGLVIEGATSVDFERGRADSLRPDPWQTDTSVGPWFYRSAGVRYRPLTSIVHELIDIVSKNGNLLLNVPPRADGTLDEECEDLLLGIGRWLAINGEAIYATRPWKVYGEGPAAKTGRKGRTAYTAADIRFTQSKDGKTLYAIVLGWPEGGETVTIENLADGKGLQAITSVELLGHDGKVAWERTAEGVKIAPPDRAPCEHAVAFKIR